MRIQLHLFLSSILRLTTIACIPGSARTTVQLLLICGALYGEGFALPLIAALRVANYDSVHN